jgi:hypothetical protein
MSVVAREYEGALAAQQAEKLYGAVLDDVKPLVKSGPVLTSADAKRIIAVAVSFQRDPPGFEKKGTSFGLILKLTQHLCIEPNFHRSHALFI